AALPPSRRRATRSVLITSVRGGSGCSLLAANLCRRLAPVRSTLGLDTSGGVGLSWWLGATAGGWHDLEDLADELTAEHLWVIASQSQANAIGGHEVFRALPRAEHEVAAAASGPRAVGGRLGAAYDELAELLVIDAS